MIIPIRSSGSNRDSVQSEWAAAQTNCASVRIFVQENASVYQPAHGRTSSILAIIHLSSHPSMPHHIIPGERHRPQKPGLWEWIADMFSCDMR